MSTAAVIPDGLEPLAVWDAGERRWIDEHWRERIAWAAEHIPRVNDTYRAEFYLIDAPFAVLYRYALNEGGSKYAKDGGPAREEPVILALAELPPRHLLGR